MLVLLAAAAAASSSAAAAAGGSRSAAGPAAAAAPAPAPPGFVDVTVYRLAPLTGNADVTGLTNVDSGDAGGDALFGLSQLLLPQLCAVEPSVLWCQNRRDLSGSGNPMGYTEYTVSTRPAFGDYAACNPCTTAKRNASSHSYDESPTCAPGMKDGTFVCEGYGRGGGSSTPTPKQCQSGFDIWHRDCLNATSGTLIKTLTDADEGACCAACTAESDCAGWNMPKGYNGSICQLLKRPLVQWNDAQSVSSCKAAEVDNDPRDCWCKPSPAHLSLACPG